MPGVKYFQSFNSCKDWCYCGNIQQLSGWCYCGSCAKRAHGSMSLTIQYAATMARTACWHDNRDRHCTDTRIPPHFMTLQRWQSKDSTPACDNAETLRTAHPVDNYNISCYTITILTSRVGTAHQVVRKWWDYKSAHPGDTIRHNQLTTRPRVQTILHALWTGMPQLTTTNMLTSIVLHRLLLDFVQADTATISLNSFLLHQGSNTRNFDIFSVLCTIHGWVHVWDNTLLEANRNHVQHMYSVYSPAHMLYGDWIYTNYFCLQSLSIERLYDNI